MIVKNRKGKALPILQGMGSVLAINPGSGTCQRRKGLRKFSISRRSLIQDWEAVCRDGEEVAGDLQAALKKLEKTTAAEMKHGG